MSNVSSPIELAYRDRIDAMTPAERVARSAAMFQWTREQIGVSVDSRADWSSDRLSARPRR